MKYWILLSFLMLTLFAQANENTVPFDSTYQWHQHSELAVLSAGSNLQQSDLSLAGCDVQIFLHNLVPIPPGTYEAMELISASDQVTTGTVIFRAGEEISLEANLTGNFEVALGATFEAIIGPCTF